MTTQHTSLWQLAFDHSRSDSSPEEQAFFRSHLENMRDRVRPLVARIATDIPEFTVHDETHLDALWETASLIGPPAVTLNPPEAFVFGAAVLLHDAGMTLAAYAGGLAELKKTAAWTDAVALSRGASAEQSSISAAETNELEAEILPGVLRQMHAEKSEELATQGWPTTTDGGERVYLIEDTELRRFYGQKIGTLAHSHWWPISKVERDLDYILGPMVPKTHNQVDLLKLACLLRTADALHLDRRRAPYFDRVLAEPKGYSADHWTAQEKLAFPRVDDDAVVFTAGEPFRREDADAWWVAYDALVEADKELKSADLLLRDRRDIRLAVRRVKGAGDPLEMARHVSVQGWRPIDTRLKISDISKIVETFGGAKLYGTRPTVALRELLQNAMDAIEARRQLQGRSAAWGRIVVELRDSTDGIWLSVEDNGIGMSEFVLTGVLLDFGSSLWKSPRLAEELPGLPSRGMNAIGRFGIGFFSVFMLSDWVRVVTRRYDQAAADALILEFKHGLSSRPTLSSASPIGAPVDGGTRVEVKLPYHPKVKGGLELPSKFGRLKHDTFSSNPTTFTSLVELIRHLAPASEVSIESVQFGKRENAVAANDWLSISPARLVKRVSQQTLSESHRRIAYKRIRKVKDQSGAVFGRASIWPSFRSFGALTTKGLRMRSLGNVVGFMDGDATVVSRSEGVLLVPEIALAEWATEQATLVAQDAIDEEFKAKCAEIVLRCGGTIFDLPVVLWDEMWLHTADLRSKLKNKDKVTLHRGDVTHETDDPISKWEFESNFKLSKEIILIPELPRFVADYLPEVSSLKDHLLGVLIEVWGEYDEENEVMTVGFAGHEEITRWVDLFQRR
jgi:hypothetical protein